MPDAYKNAASSGFYEDASSLQPIFLENLLTERVFD